MISDPATLSLLSTAICTAGYSAYRANEPRIKQRYSSSHRHAPTLSEQIVDDNTRMLEGPMAMAFPVVASASIIFLFFFLSSVGVVLTTLSVISSFFSAAFFLWPLGETSVRRLRSMGLSVRNSTYVEAAIVLPFVIAIILVWLFSGHWLSNNIIGVSLCVLFGSLCKVPNLKVASMLFVGLFAYDVFFVFFSERFFGRNVMVEVATSTPKNPAAVVANYLNLPVSPVKDLALPAKLMIPTKNGRYGILGLGDIILPELLLVYLLELDLQSRGIPLHWGYFVKALLGYSVGLILSFFCNFMYGVAQPALLYIVPAVLLPTVYHGRRFGQLRLLWNGPTRSVVEEGSEVLPRYRPDPNSPGRPKETETSALIG